MEVTLLFRHIAGARTDPHRKPDIAEVASHRDLHRRNRSDRVSGRGEHGHHAVTLVLHDLTATTLDRFGQQPIVHTATHIERRIPQSLAKRSRPHQIREHDRARTRTHNPSMHHRLTTASGVPRPLPSRTNTHGEKSWHRAQRIARSECRRRRVIRCASAVLNAARALVVGNPRRRPWEDSNLRPSD